MQFPLQQSHVALQLIVASLQTAPSGLHPCGLRQTPVVAPEAIWQVTNFASPSVPGIPSEPQQSLSFVQTPPVMRQPLAGWQMKTPVGPQGAHARLQHSPPQSGMPPSVITPPEQSSPSTSLQFALPEGGFAQVPFVPASTLQMPPQQSAPVEQASPCCPQKDEGWQVLSSAHRPEQHSAEEEQALPRVLQLELRGAQDPSSQRPLQQSVSVVQALSSDVHAGVAQTSP